MRIIISFILLIQVNYFVVYATNSEITYAICTNSTNVIFSCGVNNRANPQPSAEKSAGLTAKGEVADTPVPSFEKFKSENQLGENAEEKTEPKAAENEDSTQEKTASAATVKRSVDGENAESGDVKQPDQAKKVEEVKADSTEPTSEPSKTEAQSENKSEAPKENEQVTPEAPKETTINEVQSEDKSKQPPENDATKTQSADEKVESEKKDDNTSEKPETIIDAKPTTGDVKESSVEHISSPGASTFECYWKGNNLTTHTKTNFVSIHYQDCHFPQLPFHTTLLYTYENLRIFNVSNVGLKVFEAVTGAAQLETILASYNNLSKIHTNLFPNSSSLTTLDLSHNHISEIEPMAFDGLSELKFLNLSWNSLDTVEQTLFAKLMHLEYLDLSHNQFTVFDGQLFAPLVHLEILTLSNNLVNNINASTFTALKNLKHLDLSNLKLFSIESGTFSNLLELRTLNLANNSLNKIDFEPFHAHVNFTSINLNGNRLTDLDGFKNESFPKLESFGITNNQFNCTYLETFLKSVDSKSISFTCGQSASNGDNINGVSCEKEGISVRKYVAGMVENVECAFTTMKVTLLLLCIAMLAMVIFIVIVRRKVNKATGRAAVYELTEDAEGRREGKAVVYT